jgi:hypothetical protein
MLAKIRQITGVVVIIFVVVVLTIVSMVGLTDLRSSLMLDG